MFSVGTFKPNTQNEFSLTIKQMQGLHVMCCHWSFLSYDRSNKDSLKVATSLCNKQSATSLCNKQSATSLCNKQSATSLCNKQSATSLCNKQSATSLCNKQSATSLCNKQSATSLCNKQSATSLCNKQSATSLCNKQSAQTQSSRHKISWIGRTQNLLKGKRQFWLDRKSDFSSKTYARQNLQTLMPACKFILIVCVTLCLLQTVVQYW